MIEMLIEIFKSIWNLFNKLPPETKEKIIDVAVKSFEVMFRKYYRQHS